jgi:hypothetical protein
MFALLKNEPKAISSMRPTAITLILLSMCCLAAPLGAQTWQSDTSQPRDIFTWEIQAPFRYHASGAEESPASVAVELTRYNGSKYHSYQRPNLASEEVIGAMSIFRVGAAYQPAPGYQEENTGYAVWFDGARIINNGLSMGGVVRYSRSDITNADISVSDLELAPQVALWPGEDLYINEQLGYRFITTFVRNADDSIVARGNSIQLRHHLTYVPSEDYTFTYSQDLTLRIGTVSDPHVNNINERNYFIFSPWRDFSFAGIIGVNLDYYTRTSASVLTIPMGTRVEYFAGSGLVLRGGFEYDLPTLQGQPADRLTLFGAIGYRL